MLGGQVQPDVFARLGQGLAVQRHLDGGLGLLAAGALSSRFTPRPWWFAGLRQLLFGALAAGVTYAIGSAIGVAVA